MAFKLGEFLSWRKKGVFSSLLEMLSNLKYQVIKVHILTEFSWGFAKPKVLEYVLNFTTHS